MKDEKDSKQKLIVTYFCTKPTIGGAEYVTKLLIENLSKFYDVTYVGYNGYQTTIKCDKKFYPFTKAFDLLPMKSGIGIVMRSLPFLRHVFIKKIDLDCDVLISNSTDDDLLLINNKINYKALVAVKHLPREFSPVYPDHLISNRPFKAVALNRSDYARLSQKYGKNNTVLIYNGIDTKKNKKPAGSGNLDIDKKDKIIFSICRLEDDQKKLSYGIKAIGKLINAYPNIKYLIAGSGPDKEKYLRLVKDLGLKKNVKLLGFISDAEKLTLLGRGEIALYPSVTEGFSISTLEALRAGKIVISGKSLGSMDIIQDGRNGFFTELDSDAIADVVKKVFLSNKENINKIKRNAVLTAKKFSTKNMIKNYIDVIDELENKIKDRQSL